MPEPTSTRDTEERVRHCFVAVTRHLRAARDRRRSPARWRPDPRRDDLLSTAVSAAVTAADQTGTPCVPSVGGDVDVADDEPASCRRRTNVHGLHQ
jgi:hypothetical protein